MGRRTIRMRGRKSGTDGTFPAGLPQERHELRLFLALHSSETFRLSPVHAAGTFDRRVVCAEFGTFR